MFKAEQSHEKYECIGSSIFDLIRLVLVHQQTIAVSNKYVTLLWEITILRSYTFITTGQRNIVYGATWSASVFNNSNVRTSEHKFKYNKEKNNFLSYFVNAILSKGLTRITYNESCDKAECFTWNIITITNAFILNSNNEHLRLDRDIRHCRLVTLQPNGKLSKCFCVVLKVIE